MLLNLPQNPGVAALLLLPCACLLQWVFYSFAACALLWLPLWLPLSVSDKPVNEAAPDASKEAGVDRAAPGVDPEEAALGQALVPGSSYPSASNFAGMEFFYNIHH